MLVRHKDATFHFIEAKKVIEDIKCCPTSHIYVNENFPSFDVVGTIATFQTIS